MDEAGREPGRRTSDHERPEVGNQLCTGPDRFAAGCAQVVDVAVHATTGASPCVTAAGFTRFERVAETPFNFVYEARP